MKLPFTREQLEHFAKEIEEAGSLLHLMIEKGALVRFENSIDIAEVEDSEGYKNTYLTGVYEPLRPYYKTTVPCLFWRKMYKAMKRIL